MKITDKLSMEAAIKQLNEWAEAYEKGQPVVSDKEYDNLYFALKDAENQLGIVLENSPTQKIIYEVITELKKVKHEYQPMLSLDKTKDIEEIKSFINGKDWIAMLKLDGLSCRLTYENGKLIRAETRGNGVEGEDITHNAKVLPSIPKRLPYYGTLVIDGEIICDLNTFKKFEKEYANSRNFAAGSIRLLDSAECAKRELTFVAWDIIGDLYLSDGIGISYYATALCEKLAWLYDHCGFEVVPHFLYGDYDLEPCIKSLQRVNDTIYHYPIDGIVFKWNKCAEYAAAGRTEHHFRGGLALKFYDEEYETELLDINWTMGRTGVLTPVAVFKNVDTGDSIVNRANLHNINIMYDLLGEYPLKGQQIWIVKQNQIIPQVSRANKEQDLDLSFLLKIPDACPYCGSKATIKTSKSGTKELYCDNPDCESKLINKLDHFAGKKGLDIKGLSKATLEKLIEYGWVTKAIDLFNLNEYRADWIQKSGFGAKSVDKILAAIEEVRTCTSLGAFLSAIAIPLVGKTYANQLAQYFEDYAAFRIAIISGFDFTTLDGFGPGLHEAIINFDYQEADRMINTNIIKIEKDAPQEDGAQLEGLTFVVTGKLHHFKNRDLLKAEIVSRKGRVVETVTNKTTYLINNDTASTSAKNKKAKDLGIPIISEDDFLKLIEK